MKSFNASPQERTDGWDVATFCCLKRTLSHSDSFLAVLLKFLNLSESTGETDGRDMATICSLKGTRTHSAFCCVWGLFY